MSINYAVINPLVRMATGLVFCMQAWPVRFQQLRNPTALSRKTDHRTTNAGFLGFITGDVVVLQTQAAAKSQGLLSTMANVATNWYSLVGLA
jgi:hypothetical protein